MDAIILSQPMGLIRYAGPYVAAASARDAGYKVGIIDYFTQHKDLFGFIRSLITPTTKLVVISTTFLYSTNTTIRSTHWEVFEKYSLNFHYDNEEELAQFFQSLRRIIPSHVKLALAGERVNTIYQYYDIIPETHPIKKDVDFYFIGRNDNQLLKYLQGEKGIIHKDKFLQFDANFVFKTATIPTKVFKKCDAIQESEALSIEISRGCAFNCKYCNYDKKTINKQNNDSLHDQFLYYNDLFGTTNYYFTTDCFNDNIEFVKSFYNITQSLPFNIYWSSYARPDLAHRYPESIDMMLESGAVSNFYGIETINKNAAKLAGRGLSFDKILEVLAKFKEKKPEYFIKAFFIAGLPGDTVKSTLETIKWMSTQTIINSASIQPLEIEPTISDLKLIDNAEFSINPKKYGFSEVSFYPNYYWKHTTMDYTTALRLEKAWVRAISQNRYMNNLSSISVAELQTLIGSKNMFPIKNYSKVIEKYSANFLKKYYNNLEEVLSSEYIN
jgi:radical SAM superfamily enzyme YgiQ (UPF0313 family)